VGWLHSAPSEAAITHTTAKLKLRAATRDAVNSTELSSFGH
jgi:hypothetical protein